MPDRAPPHPTPWTVEPPLKGSPCRVLDADGAVVTVLGKSLSNLDPEATAGRIAAALNFCAGRPTKTLEDCATLRDTPQAA
jgi:hypothetical protein